MLCSAGCASLFDNVPYGTRAICSRGRLNACLAWQDCDRSDSISLITPRYSGKANNIAICPYSHVRFDFLGFRPA